MRAITLVFLLCSAGTTFAQEHAGMAMPKSLAKPSTSLTVTTLDGAATSYTPEQFKVLPHISVKVHNAHSNQDETYSGVPVDALLHPKTAAAASGGPQRVSANVQVIVAAATDDFRVVITMCDAKPECRSGETIVADVLDGKPLTTDGAFKLVLTEDKKPGRWARNLSSLTVKAVN